jgi:glutathione-specific gamma-glutamylcyclotransferase
VSGDLWVFGYGSLMWNPGFDFLESRRGRLYGYHRALCVSSPNFRGTAEDPGLVVGLDRGGSCVGLVYRVSAGNREQVIAYLDERESVGSIYQPVHGTVTTESGRIEARSYIACREGDHYRGALTVERQIETVLRCSGVSGTNVDYLRNTVAHLDALGISDGPLHAVWRAVEAQLLR